MSDSGYGTSIAGSIDLGWEGNALLETGNLGPVQVESAATLQAFKMELAGFGMDVLGLGTIIGLASVHAYYQRKTGTSKAQLTSKQLDKWFPNKKTPSKKPTPYTSKGLGLWKRYYKPLNLHKRRYKRRRRR